MPGDLTQEKRKKKKKKSPGLDKGKKGGGKGNAPAGERFSISPRNRGKRKKEPGGPRYIFPSRGGEEKREKLSGRLEPKEKRREG